MKSVWFPVHNYHKKYFLKVKLFPHFKKVNLPINLFLHYFTEQDSLDYYFCHF
jgi:hypothetical protein